MATFGLRSHLLTLALVTACGASETSVTPRPTSMPEAEAAPAPVVEAAEARGPAEPARTGEERCEGLVAPCGGWRGCVLVRPDPTTPGRLVGVGESAGHFYVEQRTCHAGVCNELCGGGSESVCRPGLAEVEVSVECSASLVPSLAPFTCALVEGACVQGPDPRMMPAS